MQVSVCFGLLILIASCSVWEDPGINEPVRAVELVEAFRESCHHFESLTFARQNASRLRGRAVVSVEGGVEPLQGVQIAALEARSGDLSYIVTDENGLFSLDALLGREYEVWTCLDGFDELRFELQLDSESRVDFFELFLAPSEAPGRRAVVAIESPESR